jgi:hypothetical protein
LSRHHSPASLRSILLRGLVPAVLVAAPAADVHADPPYPRLANMYLVGTVNPQDIPLLARYDVLFLNSVWTNSQLEQIRALRPGIKIFLYVCAYCTEIPPNSGDPWKVQNYDYAVANDLWWYNRNGSVASDWRNAKLFNITELCPPGPSGTWRQYLTARVQDLMASHPMADGVFYDNFWKTMSWEQPTVQVDSDCNPTHNPRGCDGVMDSNATLDSLWNHAIRAVATDTRARFDRLEARRPDRRLAIVGNRSSDYTSWLNGSVLEFFPSGWTPPDPGNPYGYNWNQEMFGVPEGYLVASYRASPYRVSVLNAAWIGTPSQPDRTGEFERHKRFTLGSALLGDGYYSFDAASTGHASLWWEPEFDDAGRGRGYLGQPLGPMYRLPIVSGPDALVNGSFTNGTASWLSLASGAVASFAIDASVYHSSPKAARVDVQSVLPGGSMKLYQTNVWVTIGVGYTLTFWAKATVPQDVLVHLYGNFCPGYRCLPDTHVLLGTSWTRYDIPFVANGTGGAGLDIFVSVPGSVWLDDVSMKVGDSSIYRRDFEHGTVLLNYTTYTQTVPLGGTYYRLAIPGSTVFNGAQVTSESVPPSDARILLVQPQPTASPAPRAGHAALHPNEPNPFNPRTRISFTLEHGEHVRLAVYDVAGRLVRGLENRWLAPGEHSVVWDGNDALGRPAGSGVYFDRIETPSFRQSRRMTLLE